MTTNNHPAHGPVSLDRLHQIREHLQHDTQYSNGGNRAYILADVLKVIDGAIAAFGAEPVGTFKKGPCGYYSSFHEDAVPLYTTPPATVSFPNEVSWEDVPEEITEDDMELALAWAHGFNQCRSAMIQAGNFREITETSTNSAERCWCRTCRPVTMNDMRFVVCPECRNKRCPHANDHNNACTGSNEPGQVGSAYP